MTVAELAELYKLHAKNSLMSSTYTLICDVLKPFLAWCGALKLAKIQPALFDQYQNNLTEGKRRPTVLLHLRQIRPMFTYAVDCGYLQEHPMRLMKNLYVKTRNLAFVEQAEFSKLWAALKSQWHRDFVALAILTGLRRKELIALTWQDVDLKNRALIVRHGKGAKARTVVLSGQAVRVLKHMPHTSNFLFVTEKGRPPELHYVSRMFNRARARAKMDPHIHLHSLRHSFATWALENGGSIQGVQQMMGHSSIGTTMDYTHFISGEMREVARRFPKIECIKPRGNKKG